MQSESTSKLSAKKYSLSYEEIVQDIVASEQNLSVPSAVEEQLIAALIVFMPGNTDNSELDDTSYSATDDTTAADDTDTTEGTADDDS